MRPLAVLAFAVVAGASAAAGAGGSGRVLRVAAARADDSAAVAVQAPPRVVTGHSVEHRPIRAVRHGDTSARLRILVIGCVHGNECAGTAIVRRLARQRVPAGVALWLVANLNPDGTAAGTRQNARGVDLNRNFDFRWRPLGALGDLTYSGPRPLSEPESRLARDLILRLRPAITIWYHQPLALVDLSGGSAAIERRYARLVRLPLRRLTRYHGSASSWQDHVVPGTTAFVVELPAGPLAAGAVRRHVRAVLALARDIAGG